ncbi:transcriptional regulator with XRE-family HTH domain [Gillisia sp. Hel_I_86]|uniref:helix-turn-helix domain-containing protein n=1 Tax=Gillisia sp. Hel_I_86 TaxID=1249981 RepID=UPI00119915C1|nr:helix-turn-helix domain-containing protein [Gillisia sp. Hel_I_86]TVZ26098.1 transcriptional regulator with XRE-family HTH domain [Gillisia sp. Hel_I_86]
MNSLGATLKEARKNVGLTLRQVEDNSGISNAYLSQLENEKIKNPSANILYKLSALYRVPLKTFLSSAGIIDKKNEEKDSANDSFVQKVAFSSEDMTFDEKEEVLRYLEFVKTHKRV